MYRWVGQLFHAFYRRSFKAKRKDFKKFQRLFILAQGMHALFPAGG